MASLAELHSAIQALDPNHKYENLSYQLTTNNFIAKDPFVTAPFGHWDPKDHQCAGNSPMQKAFKETLEQGAIEAVRARGTNISTDTRIYIDITVLDAGIHQFFVEGRDSSNRKFDTSVAWSFATTINETLKDITPVIRFLIGNHDAKKPFTDYWKDIQTIFWDDAVSGPERGLVTNSRAELHVGLYGPTLDFSGDAKDNLKAEVFSYLVKYAYSTGETAPVKEDELVSTIIQATADALSWNHGKILAVGGRRMISGGINFWEQYMFRQMDNIIDQSIKILGDAAKSAHNYADYFWNYLEDDHKYDANSARNYISLMAKDELQQQWSTTVKSGSAKASFVSNNLEGMPPSFVLTCCRVGAFDPIDNYHYPALIADAMRDLHLNTLPLGDASLSQQQCHDIVKAITDWSDEKSDGPFNKLLKEAKVSPAAWASRFAIQHSISKATKSVRLNNEMIALAGLQGGNSWDLLKRQINEATKSKWDGIMWPYDVLFAIATFLKKLLASTSTDPDEGVSLVLGPQKDGGWSDPTPTSYLRTRLINMLRGLDVADADAARLVKTKFNVKRVRDVFGSHLIHSKSWCIDGKLLYVGSDNLYPSYNEEHGVWLEDGTVIDTWLNTYWIPLWKNATVDE